MRVRLQHGQSHQERRRSAREASLGCESSYSAIARALPTASAGRALPRRRPAAGRGDRQVAGHLQGHLRQGEPDQAHDRCALRRWPWPRARARRDRPNRERHGAAAGGPGERRCGCSCAKAGPTESSVSPPPLPPPSPARPLQAIRAQRRGAINQKQLTYLEHSYKRRGGGGKCCLM